MFRMVSLKQYVLVEKKNKITIQALRDPYSSLSFIGCRKFILMAARVSLINQFYGTQSLKTVYVLIYVPASRPGCDTMNQLYRVLAILNALSYLGFTIKV